MKPNQPPPREEGERPVRRAAHLSEYVAILREHKWVALVPFLLIVTAAITMTLLATPSYEAAALIEIKTQASNQGLMRDLQLLESVAQIEAEMQIMRSRRVARRAAETLSGAEGGAMSDFLVEVNAYRPLEVLLRAIRTVRTRADVELRCPPLPEGKSAETFHFLFVEKTARGRYAVDVRKIKKRRFRSDAKTERVDVASGAPFASFGRTFTLTVDGDPTGHEYEVVLRSVSGLASWLRGRISVSEVGRKTGIVSLGFEAETPRLAQAAARALADSYVVTKKSQKRAEAGRAVDFLLDQVDQTKARLAEVEQELDAFRATNGVTLLSEKTRDLIGRISALEREHAELEVRRREQDDLIERLERGTVDPSTSPMLVGDEDPTLAALAQQLTSLQLERASMRDDVTDEHPDVKSVVARLETTRERMRKHVLARTEVAAERTERRGRRVQSLLAQYRGEERSLPDKERKLASLTREANSLVAIYNFLLEKKHEAEIARESTFSNTSIVDYPALPRERTSPNLLVNLLVGGFLALLAALGTAFFAEYLDRSIKTPEDLEEVTGLALYAALPAFRSIKSRNLKRLKSQMVTIERPTSVLAEGYRSLRANIRFAEFEDPVKAFAITSAVLGEGKTTTSLNLAVVLAQAGSRVIVVDADMRRPATHHHLQGELSPGLTDVLQGKAQWRDVVHPVKGVENLDIIHAGKKPSNPGALLDSDHCRNLLDALKEEYDYVAFDVPPVLAVADAAPLFRQIDAVFLLVQWRRCPSDVVLAARDQICHVGAKLRGVILNGFDARKVNRRGYGRYGYYGYYGYYGRYRGYGYGYGYGYNDDRSEEAKPGKAGRREETASRT